MWRRAVVLMVVCWLAAACNQLLGIPEATQGRHVVGRVHGLWDHADGVALRLVADGVDTRLTVSANGDFRFPPQFTPGASYTVTVIGNPVAHTCVVDGGGNGVVADTDLASLSIACTGPATTIAFSGPWSFAFDPTQELQTFLGSVIAQNVALTVGGSGITTATVNGAAATLGQPTAAIALPLGATTVHVGVTAAGGLSKTYDLVFQRGAAVIDQITYGKPFNTGMDDQFGYSISASGDTLAVGAPNEGSPDVNTPGDNTASQAGAVYIFVRTGTTWTQQAYLKSTNIGQGDQFGYAVALSGDTLAVGAIGEASTSATNPGDNGAPKAGAAYIFVRTGTTWTQQAYLKASNIGQDDQFGFSVALSGDTVAVSAPNESSSATTVDGDQTNDAASHAGAVYVFLRGGSTWTQQAYVKPFNTGQDDQFGWSVALSGDTLAVGTPREDSANPANPADDLAGQSGAVYVFTRANRKWTQQAYLKASNLQSNYLFGWSVAVSGDTLVAGSVNESSAATGVNGFQNDSSAMGAGAAYVFVRNGTTWTQQAYLKASNTGPGDSFGWSTALTADALAIGAVAESSNGKGTDGNQSDNTAGGAGAVYLFLRQGTSWTQQAYVKASNAGSGDSLGYSVALSLDILAIGAATESGGATQINGNQSDNSKPHAGAFYVFR
jgi:hypothetical protein